MDVLLTERNKMKTILHTIIDIISNDTVITNQFDIDNENVLVGCYKHLYPDLSENDVIESISDFRSIPNGFIYFDDESIELFQIVNEVDPLDQPWYSSTYSCSKRDLFEMLSEDNSVSFTVNDITDEIIQQYIDAMCDDPDSQEDIDMEVIMAISNRRTYS